MKNKTDIIGGFVLGLVGFLLMFKVAFLDRIPPSDELALGIVILASIFSGVVCAFAGHRIQNSVQVNMIRRRVIPHYQPGMGLEQHLPCLPDSF